MVQDADLLHGSRLAGGASPSRGLSPAARRLRLLNTRELTRTQEVSDRFSRKLRDRIEAWSYGPARLGGVARRDDLAKVERSGDTVSIALGWRLQGVIGAGIRYGTDRTHHLTLANDSMACHPSRRGAFA